MGVPVLVVDAFTDTPFRGNPAAVCLLDGPGDAGWMQSMARELNLPATAFLRSRDDGFELRWFSRTVELDLCGHGTLASAHALWERARLARDAAARFHTRSGLLTAEWKDGWIELDFPAEPDAPAAPPEALLPALGVAAKYVGRNRFDYLVEVESEEVVRELMPDLPRLAAVPTRGVIVTAGGAASAYDFVSRFFAPRAGIDEDAVTGSAHACLGPFWARRLGKRELTGYQASARGGSVRVRVAGARVNLGGRAVTVLRGELS
ncbi:MAG: PhzF family phenazine biosynthesis protein [Candidatus Rokubacteria bacterium]|nr:PhzF family phenazine biosynthesis protein [Candidatus Rokubacteria bacterium]